MGWGGGNCGLECQVLISANLKELNGSVFKIRCFETTLNIAVLMCAIFQAQH